MSLLHRWSFPGRGFSSSKPHIDQPCPYGKINLTSAFSALFENAENHRSIRVVEERGEAADGLPLLIPGRENVPPAPNPKYSYSDEYRVTTTAGKTTHRPGPKSIVKSAKMEGIQTPSHYPQEVSNQVTQRVNKILKSRSPGLAGADTNDTVIRDEVPLPQPSEPTCNYQRARSASSSYPSEGMRSPVTGCCSPEPVTVDTKNYFAEYRYFGRYPSQGSWHSTGMSVGEAPASSTAREDAQNTPGNDSMASNHIVVNQTAQSQQSPSVNPSQDRMEPTCPENTHSPCEPSIGRVEEQQHKSSSNSEITVPILENENALSSRLEVSFISYKRLRGQSTSNSDRNCQLGDRNTGSMDCLRASVETSNTMLTGTRRFSEAGEKPLPPPTSWMRLFVSTASNGSSNTLAQRMRKLKIRKWARRMCFRAKARFEFPGRPVFTVKRTGFRTTRRRKWRHRTKTNPTKIASRWGADEKHKKVYSGAGRALGVTRQRVMQHKKMAGDFFVALTKRTGRRSRVIGPERENKKLTCHKRAGSGPSEKGL